MNQTEFRKLVANLNHHSRTLVWEAAVEIYKSGDANFTPVLIRQLRGAKKPFQREAAAYALEASDRNLAIPHLERSLKDVKESPRVRGQVIETLAGQSSNRSISFMVKGLSDPSKHVRFWSAYALGIAGTLNKRKARVALPELRLLLKDKRKIPGFWSVRDEARWAIANLEGREKDAEELAERLERSIMRPPIPEL